MNKSKRIMAFILALLMLGSVAWIAVSAVVYQNYENGYAVLRLRCQDGQTVTVVGTIPLPAIGSA